MLKRNLPLVIVFVTAMLLVVAFFIPHRPFGDLESRFLNWYTIVSGFTFLLGLDSLTRHHLTRVFRRTGDWGYSLVLVLSLFATMGLGFYSWFKFQSPFALRAPFMWLYTYMIIPLQATMFASLAFFIVSAAYRAFRVRNFAATLLLIAACLVMLGNVPLEAELRPSAGLVVAGHVFDDVDALLHAGQPQLVDARPARVHHHQQQPLILVGKLGQLLQMGDVVNEQLVLKLDVRTEDLEETSTAARKERQPAERAVDLTAHLI